MVVMCFLVFMEGWDYVDFEKKGYDVIVVGLIVIGWLGVLVVFNFRMSIVDFLI